MTKEILQNLVIERFKLGSAIDSLEKTICNIAEQKILKEFGEKPHFENEKKYKLCCIDIDFCIMSWQITIPSVNVKMYYVSESETTKAKKREVQLFLEENAKNKKIFPKYWGKNPIGLMFQIELTVEQILKNQSHI